MSFRPMNLTIVLLPQGEQPKAQAALDTIREQCDGGYDANGQSTDYNWRQSGHLLDDANATPDGKVVFVAPYAQHANNKQPFAGIAPQYQGRFEEKLQPVVNQFLAFEKVE